MLTVLATDLRIHGFTNERTDFANRAQNNKLDVVDYSATCLELKNGYGFKANTKQPLQTFSLSLLAKPTDLRLIPSILNGLPWAVQDQVGAFLLFEFIRTSIPSS